MIIVQSDGCGKKGPMWWGGECVLTVFFAVSYLTCRCAALIKLFLHVFNLKKKIILYNIDNKSALLINQHYWWLWQWAFPSGTWVFSSGKVLHINHSRRLFFVVIIVRQCCRTTLSQSWYVWQEGTWANHKLKPPAHHDMTISLNLWNSRNQSRVVCSAILCCLWFNPPPPPKKKKQTKPNQKHICDS